MVSTIRFVGRCLDHLPREISGRPHLRRTGEVTVTRTPEIRRWQTIMSQTVVNMTFAPKPENSRFAR
jgi:hypothetical protein